MLWSPTKRRGGDMNRVSEKALIDTMTTISGTAFEADGSSDPLDQNFGQMGFDSLARQELMGRLERTYGVRFDADLEFDDASTPRELLATIYAQNEASA
jgi:acyl carrier protein